MAAMLAAGLEIYILSSRRTGKTTRMIANLKDGDQVVTLHQKEADRLRRIFKERKLDVRVITIAEPQPHEVLTRVSTASGRGRTHFDHSWVEAFFSRAIDNAAKDFDSLVSAVTGWQETHERTRKAAEMARAVPDRTFFEIRSRRDD
ncbi:hypothetical protein [Mesorhizobium sp. ANAO-SY3R2]|uniref:hypothetical protein n=1 Tax=Mesorhizobium sp. ANAO-SY3R2 TaxID=3166644 RepID=UPI00366E8108